MDSRYTPATLEAKWQKIWVETEADRAPDADERPDAPAKAKNAKAKNAKAKNAKAKNAKAKKFYALSMFPYPSGNLHMGHVRNYTITDAIARVRRMQGYRVLHPMGWDAFGLPAENAAIDRGIAPADWTYKNIDQMRSQLRRLGLSYDWGRELATCSPDYYRWTQWLFLEFYKAGLAYQREAAVNWDPVDQTVLANEQVDSEGRSWRSGAKVERKLLRQWFLKITDYAEALLADLDGLDGWPERVKTMQANWIGKSVGARVRFASSAGDIEVFTTRPDTLWGATFMVLSPEHPLVAALTTPDCADAVKAYQEAAAAKSEIERTDEGRAKTGVFTGSTATNPVNGREIPVWIADYVLMDYGTGAIMAVPAHDRRDFEFATEYGLDILPVVFPPDADPDADQPLTEAYVDAGAGVLRHSGPLDGLAVPEAKTRAIAHLEAEGIGSGQTNYRLRDWLISRQRYWGVPIPVVHCPSCGAVPVPEDQLPVKLPEQVEFSGRGPSPLAQLSDWANVPCPTCGEPARRETDTMDTFIDSSWYFLRYADARNEEAAFDPAKANDWMPVDQYVGGIEHAILHLLYSRFFTKFLRDRGLLNCDEPFKRLLTQGMVQAMAYKNPETGKYLAPEAVDLSAPDAPKDRATGAPLQAVYEKMSKSKYNGVDPASVLAKYGADTARMFVLFKAPPEKDLEWDDADVEGQFRFLNRVWRLVAEFVERGGSPAETLRDRPKSPQKPPAPADLSKPEKDLRRAVHTAIAAVAEDFEGDYQLNTAISELMKLSNALSDADCKTSPVYGEGVETLLKLLAPLAPHIAEELWAAIGGTESVHAQSWPEADPAALVADEVELVIQIQGKTRGTIAVPASSDKAQLETLARESEVGQKYLDGKTVKKAIVVPQKPLVNFVLAQ